MSSQIPVMTPRPPQSSLPSSLSTPQLGLVSPGKYLAVSGSPSYPPALGNPPPGSNASGGHTPFRSFRNLLSFGSAKNNSTSPAGISQSAAASRTSLGILRRSINGERSVSTPYLVPPKVQDEAPALIIELSHRVDEPLFDKDELRDRLCLEPSSPQTASSSPLSSRASVYGADQPGNSILLKKYASLIGFLQSLECLIYRQSWRRKLQGSRSTCPALMNRLYARPAQSAVASRPGRPPLNLYHRPMRMVRTRRRSTCLPATFRRKCLPLCQARGGKTGG